MVTERYCVNDKYVAYEAMDDEILAVNLETGRYYTLGGSGARIWQQLLAGGSVDSITDILCAAYVGDRGEMAASVAAFLQRLNEEALVRPSEPRSGAPEPVTGNGHDARPFVPPSLEVFTDMQDLLLLDPIHEVDEAGWPVLKLPTEK